jgi:hypothetical protein
MDHRHFQGHVLMFYNPGEGVLWQVPDIVSYRLAPGNRPYGLPFIGFVGNNNENSVPRLNARLEDLLAPMPINLTLASAAERALQEIYDAGAIVGGADVVTGLGMVLYTMKNERHNISHRVGYIQNPVPNAATCRLSEPRSLSEIGFGPERRSAD